MSVEKDFYTELAKMLFVFIGNRTYYTSTITDGDGFDFKFSIVIYRDDNNKITDIVPVWYEFHNKNLGENFEFDFDKLVETVKTI